MLSRCMSDERELARVWRGITGHLQLEINPAGFDVWFEGTRPLQLDEGGLIVEARTPFVADWLNQRFAHVVRRVAASFFEADLDVRFVPPGAVAAMPGTGSDSLPATCLVGELNSRLTFDSYLVGESNRLAMHCARALLSPDERAISPLAVWGPPGVGKTHLLHALANGAMINGWSVACLSGEQFVNRYVGAVRRKEVESFQSSIRGVRLLIVDDLQYLAGKPGTQDELTHTIDAVSNSGGHVVVAAETHPIELDLPARLSSRLSAGIITSIEPFALADRRRFVQETARSLHAPLPAWCVERLAHVPASSVRVLQGAVHGAVALDRCGLLVESRLDAELARIVARETACTPRPAEAIVAAVAHAYQTTLDALASSSRSRNNADARAVAAALLQESGRSLAEIGKLFERDRTTMGPLAVRGRKIIETRPELRQVLAS